MGDYNNAQAFLKIAKEKLPEKSEWEIWDQILPKLDDISGAYQKAKEALQNELEKNKYQRGYFRKWAADLITLQNNSLNIDLEE
ncbi:MAG: hypothetical protein ACREV6_05890 [Clostridium sp.]|uniref:hypothetical protein n=1 Tax=Clostridium sp. TaxID=1506 RepID=UPI003D6CC589